MSLGKPHSRKLSSLKKSKSKSFEINYTTQDLPSLRRKRTIAYKRLTKALEVGILAANDPIQKDLFLSYYQEVKQISATFEDAHFTIQEIVDDDPETEDNEIQERFDEIYYKVLSIYRSLTKVESTQSSGGNSSNIRLPKIALPTFNGNIKKWPEYFDIFNALIHSSTSITDTEKFHYLLSSLSGDALTVVKPFPLTHEHYHDAFQALTARYQKKRDLAFTCWRDILNVEFKCNDAQEFRKSLDLFEENLSILKTVNLPVGHWDFVLVYHILSKLDPELRRDFEEKHSGVELPTYNQLKIFLNSKCEALSRDTHFTEIYKSKKPTQKPVPAQPQPKRNVITHTLVAAAPPAPLPINLASNQKQTGSSSASVPYTSKCSFCAEAHSIAACAEFLKKSLDERMKIVTEKNWCFNCLKPSHQLKDCKSIFSCRSCRRKHHSLLHRDKPIEPTQSVSSLVSRPSHTSVLLATAIVQIKNASGAMQSFRALFDTGSQSNFITESAVKRLNLNLTPANTNVSGLGEAVASIVGDVTCELGANNKVLFTLNMHVISTICGDQPIAKLNTSGWSHIDSLPLADPGFDIPGSIDLLLAADVFADSLFNQQIKGYANQPTAFNSVFGWLLLGKTQLASSTLHTSLNIDNELNCLVQHFWELDSVPKANLLTPEEALCEQKFVSDHSRDSSGRYMVSLPFKDDVEPSFLASRDVALRRFHATERRLSRDPDLHYQYSEFMSDYIDAGHMSLVPADELSIGESGAQLGEVDNCDASQLKECVALIPRTPVGLPRTKDELDAHCLAYQTGMSCMDTWIKRCLPTDGQKLLQQQIGGARALMRFLCTNETALRKEFLREPMCWSRVSPDWSRCVDELQDAVREIGDRAQQLTYFNRNAELCCARDAFLKCVAEAGRTCPASASTLLKRMAWVLAQDVAACSQQPRAYCSAPSPTATAPLLTALCGIVFYPPNL